MQKVAIREGIMASRKARPLVVAAILCTVLGLGVTTAVAAGTTAKAATVFHACLKNGILSDVSTKSHTCSKGFKAVEWNQTGPKGPKGATGPAGPMGPSNSFSATASDTGIGPSFTPIVSVDLGVGSFVVDASVWVEDTSPSDASDLVVCDLSINSGTVETVEMGLLGPSSTPENNGTLALTGAATIPGPASGGAEVSCAGEGNTGEIVAEDASITAIQSSSLNGGSDHAYHG
jgi:hypothetical protein